ncbi:MAG: hypothetical protein EOP88_15900 [Verrucomicrobiaceae bacterium]|nr:MAG: hypothetical protein EOP88_15900 [Verrucomicrobiaceae bacterium]
MLIEHLGGAVPSQKKKLPGSIDGEISIGEIHATKGIGQAVVWNALFTSTGDEAVPNMAETTTAPLTD